MTSPFTDATLCDASAFVTACAAAAVMIIKAAQMSGCTHVRVCGGALSCGHTTPPGVSKKNDDNGDNSDSCSGVDITPPAIHHVYYDDSDSTTTDNSYHMTEAERRV